MGTSFPEPKLKVTFRHLRGVTEKFWEKPQSGRQLVCAANAVVIETEVYSLGMVFDLLEILQHLLRSSTFKEDKFNKTVISALRSNCEV